jgi:hypothetical protein
MGFTKSQIISTIQYSGLLSGSYISGSVVSASYATTASYAMNGGGGGGGTPGGAIGDIQFNNGSGGFTGTDNFNYNDGTQLLSYKTNTDFTSTSISTDPDSSIKLINTTNTLFEYEFKSHLIQWNKLVPNGSTEAIVSFNVHSANLESLNILGFKCDYSLTVLDGSNKFTGTRVGTLYGAWDFDESVDPSLNQIYVAGDSAGFLNYPEFNLKWDGDKIILYMTRNGKDLIFSGLFTVFINKHI